MADETCVGSDDVTLALRMMEGDEDALTELLVQHGPKIKGFLIKHYGDTLKMPEIEEALNVAAYNVWRFAGKFDDSQGTLAGWFLRIAQNAARDIIKQETRHTNKSLEYDPEYDPAQPHWAEDDEQDLEDNEKIKLLQEFDKAIKQLPPLQKAIILADLEAGDQADDHWLAKRHGTSVNSIRVSRNKAWKNLQKLMEHEKNPQSRTKG